ncbi:MAG: hydrogenase [Candidatus Korarchaeota archaeon NZ13-K]|nr:MAG: hydrogenase [Candidatus Korarchaeota archaeon NZ13-K]
MSKGDLPKLLSALKEFGEVHGPVRYGKFHSFRRVDSADEMDLSYTRTMIPPKKYFVRPREEILRVNLRRGYELLREEPRNIVLFGLHACDINAIKVLDSIYMDEHPDPYYASRRERTLIVGISCLPDDECFCRSMGTDYAYDGFDLFLHDIGESYILRVASERGESLLEGADFLKKPEREDFMRLAEFERRRASMFKKELISSHLPDVADSLHDSDAWNEYVSRCLACGSCNLVCPTCRCYDVFERVDLSLENGVRERRWDSCFLRSHALVAGGLNFRPTRFDRFVHRYNCKSGINVETGLPYCVGCGRCTVFCPAGIDHVEVLNSVWGVVR